MYTGTGFFIEWFKGIEDKPRYTFVVFDIVEFYPSITKDLLLDALSYAGTHVPMSKKDIETILHARKSLLFDGGKAWMKKEKDGSFDVTMGSYDGAEACELVGALILSKLRPLLGDQCVGLYRDDGLAIMKDATGHDADRTRKQIIQIFQAHGLKITIETNKKIVDYLDVTLNLATGTFQPYRKPNSTPLYVDVRSCHPPQVLRQIPIGINKRLQRISCNEEVFNDAKTLYEDALASSGHPKTMTYKDEPSNKKKKAKKGRSRDVIWFNPPYSTTVKTNVGAKFLYLVKKHFPEGSALHKVFNKNTTKVSYSCMKNVASIIKGHNAAKLHSRPPVVPCNCRVKASCPLNGDCQSSDVVYEAHVASNEVKTYVGMTAATFKQRYNKHTSDFRHEKYAASTKLSKHIWDLKHENRGFDIRWEIKDRAPSYSNISKKCGLCLTEKFHILKASKATSLNKRSELVSKCPHQCKFLLATPIT